MKLLTAMEKQVIYNLHDLGKSSKSITTSIGRSYNCVVRTIKNRAGDGLYETTASGRRVYTEEFKTELRKLSAEGVSNLELSKQFNMQCGSVHNIVVVQAKTKATPEPVVVPKPEPRQITIPLEHKYVFYLGIGAEELKMINHLVKHFVQEFDKR